MCDFEGRKIYGVAQNVIHYQESSLNRNKTHLRRYFHQF